YWPSELGNSQRSFGLENSGSASRRSTSSSDCDCERENLLRSSRARSRVAVSTPNSQFGTLSMSSPGGNLSLDIYPPRLSSSTSAQPINALVTTEPLMGCC